VLLCMSWYDVLRALGWGKELIKGQVRVGHDKLVGEVIRINGDQATIQVYEETGRPCLHAVSLSTC